MAVLIVIVLMPVLTSLVSRLPIPIKALRFFIVCSVWLHLCLSLGASAPLWQSQTVLRWSADLCINHAGGVFLLLTDFIVACAVTHSTVFFANETLLGRLPKSSYEAWFYTFSMLFLLSMNLIFLVDNLGYLWIAVEATTLSSAALVYYGRDKHALEATWKYLIVCSVGIAFALLGTILIFASSQFAGGEGTLELSLLQQNANVLQPKFIQLGYIFCLLGYGTKAGIFPLHTWLPDAHAEAPAPASAMLSGTLLNCALYAIWRVSELVKLTAHHELATSVPLMWGALTAFAASLFLVNQRSIKRLWAYSSIENVGIMLVTIGMGTLPLFLFQAISHSLSKSALFLLSGNITQFTGKKDMRAIKRLLNRSPVCAVCFALAALSVTGMPPFGTFLSEWMILTQAFEQSQLLCAFILLFALVLSFIAVSLHVWRMLSGRASINSNNAQINNSSTIPILLCLCSLILGVTSLSQGLLALK